jgi:hypothetical protein
MGEGDFGSNRSVHWNVRHSGKDSPGRFSTVDRVPYRGIGEEGGRPGFFHVTLKFENDPAARAALDAAKEKVKDGFVTILVPTIPERGPERAFDPPEVKVVW